MQLCCIVEVHRIGFLHTLLFAKDRDVVSLSLNGEVAGHAYGIENGDVVLLYVDFARSVHLAYYAYLVVLELYEHNCVKCDSFADNLFFEIFRKVVPCHALYMYCTQLREVDIAVPVNCEGELCLLCTDTLAGQTKVQRCHKLLVFAVHMYRELVTWL